MGAAFSSSKLGFQTNDYELAIKSSKELEWILEQEFGATGRGLHEKITSACDSCPGEMSPALVRDMRYLATIRNKLIHERNVDSIPDKKQFVQRFQRSQDELAALVQLIRTRQQRKSQKAGGDCVVM